MFKIHFKTDFSVFRWTPTIAPAVWKTCRLQRLSLKRTGKIDLLFLCRFIEKASRLYSTPYVTMYLATLVSFLIIGVLCCRCANCFDCPCCMHTLSTRATNIPAPLPDDPTKTAMKKAYYLACGFCRWTSRDVGMADKSVGEC